ncbi:MAG TPA: hypothetical protein PLA94_10265, partial [Myxococcota bacterium]|nr:hypothetical protein [Myxococcota bacterium]
QPRRLVADLIARGWLDPQKDLDEGGMTMPDFVSAWRWQAREPYLFREMMGMMHNEARMVNLSDGGHLENLGVYELLRRRCRYIIVGDGEADPTMQFGSLAALIRYARIDMGIQIDIDLADIRLGKEGAYGRQHAAVGTVYYPKVGEQPAEIGILLYFKASLTGDEDSMLAQYKSSSPSFPHESTADQFFSEAQFEAYRSLGNHVVTSLLRECLSARRVHTEGQGVDSFDALMAMFRRVRVLLSTQAQSEECLELQQQAELGRIMGEDGPNFAFDYYSELYPEVDDSNEDRANRLKTDPAYRRRMLEIVARQLSLMESIYLKLDLHHARNRELESYSRWINLFRGWARSPSFRWASTLHAPTMGPAFRVFCQDVLGLRWGLIWRKVEVEDRAWFAGKTDPNAILLVGSITVAGEPLCPTEDLACVSFVDQGGTLRLSTHALRHGFQGVDVYRLFLIGLGGLRVGRSPLLPQPRLFAAEISDLLPQYQNDVDAQDLLMEIRGSNAEP